MNVGLDLTGTFVLSTVEHHETARIINIRQKMCVSGNPTSHPIKQNSPTLKGLQTLGKYIFEIGKKVFCDI